MHEISQKEMKIVKKDSESELSPEALRALEEAACRHNTLPSQNNQVEIGGAQRMDPTRYGDWELKGRAIDF